MKPLPRFLLSTLLCATAGNAIATSSVDLSATGLITPSACTPTLAGGGTVDYGKMSVKDLNPDPDQMTQLEKRIQPINITCETATLVALQSTDNRAGTSYGGGEFKFGLGLVNNTEKLGDIGLIWKNLTADGVSMRSIRNVDNGFGWVLSAMWSNRGMMSVTNSNVAAPMPITVLNGDIELSTNIAPTSHLTLGRDLTLDGSVTLTVRYL